MPELCAEDISLITAEVDRFARGSIAPVVERPELKLPQPSLNALVNEACDIGLLSKSEPSGGGIWEQAGATSQLSIQSLTRLAETNAGIAMRFHQFSLLRYLLEALELPTTEIDSYALSLTGFYGLGSNALPRFLSKEYFPAQRKSPRSTEAEDLNFLRCWFTGEGNTPFVFYADSNWETLLHPSIDSNDHFIFSRYARKDLALSESLNSHGFDELSAFCCDGFAGVTPLSISTVSSAAAKEIYAIALQFNALAYLAIGLGATKRAFEISSKYASIREQGGSVINQHPAVQLLLSTQRKAIDNATINLDYLGNVSITTETLAKVFSVSATTQSKLCEAANAAMQCGGGIGYMQDTGIEKILRDCNALRVMDGTPTELSLFVAEWERIHD